MPAARSFPEASIKLEEAIRVRQRDVAVLCDLRPSLADEVFLCRVQSFAFSNLLETVADMRHPLPRPVVARLDRPENRLPHLVAVGTDLFGFAVRASSIIDTSCLEMPQGIVEHDFESADATARQRLVDLA